MAKSPSECFSLFFTDEILEKIVQLTNLNIDKYLERMSPEQLVQYTTDDRYGSWVHHTDLREMKAF